MANIAVKYTEPKEVETNDDETVTKTHTTSVVEEEIHPDRLLAIIAGYQQTHDVEVSLKFKEIK